MKLILAILIVLAFCFSMLATPNFLQQCTAVGNSYGAIDDVLPFYPSAGNIYIAQISHPTTSSIDDVSGDDGATHLHKISWIESHGIVIEVWKAFNIDGCCKNFHIGIVGTDTVVVQFAEWAKE